MCTVLLPNISHHSRARPAAQGKPKRSFVRVARPSCHMQADPASPGTGKPSLAQGHCRSPERQQGPQLESPHPLLPQGLVLPDRPGPLGRGFVLRKKRKRGRSKGQKQEILANSQQKDDGDQRAIHVCCTPGPTASTSRTSFICHVCPMKQKQRDQGH